MAGSVRYEWTGTMCVCWSLARVCGSREPARATFSATGRSASWRSSARKTRANAPRPSSSTSRNPAIVWPASGKGIAGVCGLGIESDAWPEPTSPWMSSTRRSPAATSGNRASNSAGSGDSSASSRRQNSS